MKLFISAPDENWILDTMAMEYRNNTRHDLVSTAWNADLVWSLWSGAPEHNNIQVNSQWHIVPWKRDSIYEFDSKFANRDKNASAWITCNWRTKAELKEMTRNPVYLMPYWVDMDFWQGRNYDMSRKSLGISDDQFIIGSFQRDTEGHGDRIPKTEKGPDTLVRWVKKFQGMGKSVHVLLGGWRRSWVQNALTEAGL